MLSAKTVAREKAEPDIALYSPKMVVESLLSKYAPNVFTSMKGTGITLPTR